MKETAAELKVYLYEHKLPGKVGSITAQQVTKVLCEKKQPASSPGGMPSPAK